VSERAAEHQDFRVKAATEFWEGDVSPGLKSRLHMPLKSRVHMPTHSVIVSPLNYTCHHRGVQR
jgi:hypothetical protein